MEKSKIAIEILGHYIYFKQFEQLRKEPIQKSAQLGAYLESPCAMLSTPDIFPCADAFEAVRKLKKADANQLSNKGNARDFCR